MDTHIYTHKTELFESLVRHCPGLNLVVLTFCIYVVLIWQKILLNFIFPHPRRKDGREKRGREGERKEDKLREEIRKE